MTLPSIDGQLHITDVISALIAAGILGLLGKIYGVIKAYLRAQHAREQQLDATSKMVDRHTLALRKAALLGPPAARVYRKGRRRDDEDLDILIDDEAAFS